MSKVVIYVVMIVIIVVIIVIVSRREKYCNCVGIGHKVNGPSYPLWGEQTSRYLPLSYLSTTDNVLRMNNIETKDGRNPFAYGTMKNAYLMGSNELRDIARDISGGFIPIAQRDNTTMENLPIVSIGSNPAANDEEDGCNCNSNISFISDPQFFPLSKVGGSLQPGVITEMKPIYNVPDPFGLRIGVL